MATAWLDNVPTEATDLTIRSVWRSLKEGYRSKVPSELQLLDLYVAFLAVVLGVITSFAAVVGTYPFNSLLAAAFCLIGSAVLTVGLRMQINARNRTKLNRWEHRSFESAYVGWLLGHLVLFLTAVNFVG